MYLLFCTSVCLPYRQLYGHNLMLGMYVWMYVCVYVSMDVCA
jgi:hypothetical protein